MLQLLRRDRTTAEIAAELFVSETTVRTHVSAILRKLRVPDRRAARRLLEEASRNLDGRSSRRPTRAAAATPIVLAMARIRLADERGIALVLALATLTVLTITATTALTMATRSSAHAGMYRAGVVAHALAEAGLNNAMSILANPANNAMNSSLLPSQTSQYVGGQVAWSGTLDTIAAMLDRDRGGHGARSSGAREHADAAAHGQDPGLPEPFPAAQQPGVELRVLARHRQRV